MANGHNWEVQALSLLILIFLISLAVKASKREFRPSCLIWFSVCLLSSVSSVSSIKHLTGPCYHYIALGRSLSVRKAIASVSCWERQNIYKGPFKVFWRLNTLIAAVFRAFKWFKTFIFVIFKYFQKLKRFSANLYENFSQLASLPCVLCKVYPLPPVSLHDC